MRKKFLPISLLLTIIILAQTNFAVNANGGSGKYVPRTAGEATAQAFMKSIRANQETGLIDPAWLVSSKESQLRNENGLNWTSLGPDNYGSLTRGIIYDNQDATNRTLYIGTMGGGVFKSVNGGITWKTEGQNLMVSCMAQTEDGKVFIGTGDGRGAHNHNGLAELNYETSFGGSGLYVLGSNEPIEGTEDWQFVNDLATFGNIVYAATNKGLYRYEDNTFKALVDTVAVYGVELCANGDVLAVVDKDVYLFNGADNAEPVLMTTGEENMLPKDDNYKIIATSPSDDNYMYVSYLTKTYGTGNIYMTSDHGKTWQVAYATTQMHDIYGSRGLLDNGIAVYPNNPRKLLIGGLNLWVMNDELGEGIFRIECISDGSGFQISQSGGNFFYNYQYVHTGIQAITFNPNNVNEFFIGTEGGVFKGSYTNNSYIYEGANRYFETAENHTSVARMFNVAMSGEESRILGGSLDHGTINIYGEKDVNNESTGSAIFPNDIASTDAAATYGAFDFTKAGGPCAISTIDPNVVFVTATGKLSVGTPLLRSERAGADYDKENFSYSATENTSFVKNANAFRTPIALFENYNDQKSIDSVKYFAKRDFIYIIDTINDNDGTTTIDTIIPVITDVRSANGAEGGYPFEYIFPDTWTETLKHGDTIMKAGDSIMIKDIISSTFLAAVEGKVLMTRQALQISKKINWWTIAKVSGIPSALTISADGDVAYVGTLAGKLYRISGISNSVNKDYAEGIPAQLEPRTEVYDTTVKEITKYDTIWYKIPVYDTTFANDTAWINDSIIDINEIITYDTTFKTRIVYDTVAPAVPSIVETKEINDSIFNGQAITSVAIDPNNSNEVIVTLGNYGNENYVFHSTDGTIFSAVELPVNVPAYSSLIIKNAGEKAKYMIGTEKGLYTSKDLSTWTLDKNIQDVPVMEIKQQVLENHDPKYVYLIDEVGDTTAIEYPAIKNQDIVYIATYGRGLYRCNDYVKTDGENVNIIENTSAVKTMELSIYPNPVASEATISFNMNETANVTYQIFDLAGRMVQNVTLGTYTQGTHTANFNVDGLTAGTYIVKLQAGTVSNVSKILVY